MQQIEKSYHVFLIIVLIVIRLFVSGRWVNSISISGLFVALLNIIVEIIKDNRKRKEVKEDAVRRERFGGLILFLALLDSVVLLMVILNGFVEIDFLNNSLLLDEVMLVELLLSYSQPYIVLRASKYIKQKTVCAQAQNTDTKKEKQKQ